MKVCICTDVNDSTMSTAIKEAPILPQDPYSIDYVGSEDQIYHHLQDTLQIGTKCANCELFIRQLIRDYLDRRGL